jgi:hypothetical protein
MKKKVKGPRYARLDSNESIFFARELETIKSRSYDVKYPMLKQREVIPVSFEGDPADDQITYNQYDMFGMAAIVSDYSTDFRNVEISGKQFSANVRSLGAAFQYSIQEIRKAARANKPLTTAKANAARRAIMQLERDIAFWGDDDYGLQGWLTNTNIPDVTLPTGDWLNTLTTPDSIIKDLNALANSVIDTSRTVETPNTLLLPVAYYTHLATLPRSSGSDYTVLRYFMENTPFIQSVDWLAELAAANSEGNLADDIAIVYDRNPEKMTLEIPQEFEQFAPELRGMAYKVAVHERCGGVIIPYPLSQAMTDDIGSSSSS